MAEPCWRFESSVDSDASPEFAWKYWTDIRNWSDPPARFSLEGPFAPGARGATCIPGQEPLAWVIAEMDPGKSAAITMQLDRAEMRFHWRFEGLSERRTRLTQSIALTGENAGAYQEAASVFAANLPGGMKKMAAAMAEAEAALGSSEQGTLI